MSSSLSLVFLGLFGCICTRVFSYTPTIDDVNNWFDSFDVLVETGDNSDVLSLFAPDARYCSPDCVIGEEAIIARYLNGIANLVPLVTFTYSEVTLDDTFFLVDYNAFIKNGECEATVSGTNLVFYNDDGLVIENYGVNKPNDEVFFGIVVRIATADCGSNNNNNDDDDNDDDSDEDEDDGDD